MRLQVAVLAGLWTLACGAQEKRPEPAGTVMGHVTCQDTQRPARLAQVKLIAVPLPEKAGAKTTSANNSVDAAAPAGNAVETSLDGSFTIRRVKPGRYFVVVDKDGYLLPLSEFTKEDLAATDDETRARVAKVVHAITVEADHTVQEDVVLERGASVSGTVTYDDGTPASDIVIQLLVKDKDGKWVMRPAGRYRSGFAITSTDDYGNYRIPGLPPGEYATEAVLSLNDQETTTMAMPNSPNTVMMVSMFKSRFSLSLYSGDVLRRQNATAYSLGSGEVRAGGDLVFPLSKLHRVGGQVVAKDGHTVNGGEVKLVYADDQSQLAEATVQYDDAAFHLEYVPEGDFVLKVSGAKDLTMVQVENSPGSTPRFREESKTVKTYGDAEQPLVVKGDVSDVVAMVPEIGKSKGAAQ